MDKATLDKINLLTCRKFKAEELYTFPVVLCHNDIDRDFERFTDTALEELAKLFVGKTGIFDHNPSADNQSARIYDAEVVEDAEKTTAWGGVYKYVKGYAYMPKTEANADLITEIDAGIKKEVSVSCSSTRCTCSICGADRRLTSCEHVPGKEYGGTVCHFLLDGITDAYEWSFVAVPAQVGAGVTKARSPRGQDSPNAAEPQRSNTNFITKGGTIMDFTPINTQAELDAAAKPLIDAAVAEAVKAFDGWLSPEDHQKALDEQTAANKAALLGAYRAKAAVMAGLAPELADRLTGDTEEDIQKDAEKLAGYTIKSEGTPRFSANDGELDGVEKAFREKNPNVKL